MTIDTLIKITAFAVEQIVLSDGHCHGSCAGATHPGGPPPDGTSTAAEALNARMRYVTRTPP